MAEQLDLTGQYYRVRELTLNRDVPLIRIRLVGAQGEIKVHDYLGSTATTLINQLNTLNMSTTSMEKRILQRLVTDGILAGTVTGSPD